MSTYCSSVTSWEPSCSGTNGPYSGCWPRFNLPLCVDTAVLPLPLLCRPLLSHSKMPSSRKYFSVKWVTWSPPHKVNSFYVKLIHALSCSWASLRNKSCEPLRLGPVIHAQNTLQASNRRYPIPCLEFSSWKFLKLTSFSSEQIGGSSPGHLSHCVGGTVRSRQKRWLQSARAQWTLFTS